MIYIHIFLLAFSMLNIFQEIAKLIRAHAYKVSEFVKKGPPERHRKTPMPEDYKAPED